MSDNTTKEFCAFPAAVGLDRVLQAQQFLPKDKDNNKIIFSWPYPSEANGLSCNAVILGKPGTGKSTLALEMASRLRIVCLPATSEAHRAEGQGETATVIYYSLEQSAKSLKRRHDMLDPDTSITHIGPTVNDELWTLYKYRKNSCVNAKELCGACKYRKTKNLVLFPQLSPRRLEQTGEKLDDSSVFWQRLSEIRNLVEKIRELERDEAYVLPKLRMVIIDSLNVFGDRPISRYLIEQLFAFFVEQKLVGVFVAEDPELAIKTVTEEPHISPGIANIADVVIKMQWEQGEGYSSRGLEVEKSRFTSNIYGLQQVKMRSRGVEVLPSIHSWYSFLTEYSADENTRQRQAQNRLKAEINGFNGALNANSVPPNVPSIVFTLSGPKDSCKTPIAMSYALSASNDLQAAHGNSKGKFLLVSLDVSPEPDERAGGFGKYEIVIGKDNKNTFPASGLINQTKGKLSKVYLKDINDASLVGFQLWLAPGFLLAEELVHYLYEMLRHDELKEVTRVVIQDIGLVPMRYPIIYRHINQHGNLFTVVMELFRKLGVDCMFVCGNVDKEAARVADSLMSVSHCTIRTERESSSAAAYDPVVSFGGRYVENGIVRKTLQWKNGSYELGPVSKSRVSAKLTNSNQK